MKKNILKIAFVAVFGIAVSYNVYSSKSESELSNLMLDNVEALANVEVGGYTSCRWDNNFRVCTKINAGSVCILTTSNCNWL